MGSMMYRLSDDVIYAVERNRDDFAAHMYEDVMCALKKLRQYENTGLTPGEVHSLWGEWNAMMSVLNSIGGYDRLRKLAEADKAGRAVILPCKTGDTVYRISWRLNGRHEIEERVFSLMYFDPAKYGKDYFLTREEAEKALEEEKDD